MATVATMVQLAMSPLLTNFAVTASQKAIKPVGNFIFPICQVPDVVVRYRVYDDKHRFKIADSKREPGAPATRLGFSSSDATVILEPNALDFPIPNLDGLSDQALQWSLMEGQSILADQAALSLEREQINLAVGGVGSTTDHDFSDDTIDPIEIIDDIILDVILAAQNGAPVKVLFGMTAFKKFRNNAKVRARYIVATGGAGGSAGQVSPNIDDVGNLFITKPKCALSQMVMDTAPAGKAKTMSFLLDEKVIIFAGNDDPNRMDPSFGKTFATMGGFFKPGSYMTVDQRDQVLKMDWITLPKITNSSAAQAIDTTT